jgi:hypothetical protein
MSIQERHALMIAEVTLDGRPAIISGWALDYAQVRSLDGALSGEWAWTTAARIVGRGGAFRT